MNKNIIKILKILLLISIAFGILYLGFNKLSTTSEIKNTSEIFIKSLTEGDIKKASSLSTGKLTWNLNNAKLPPAKLLNVDIYISNYSNKWAKVQVTTELSLKSGIDIGWYELYLINNSGWKIYGIKETSPQIDRSLISTISNHEIELIKETLNDYLILISKNEYTKANNFLIGSAKKAQEQLMQNPKLNFAFSDLELIPLYKGVNFINARANYKIDNGKEIDILVSFYKTSQGYKIIEINTL